jgi:5-methylcytosine-specific restriction endonuclease McrBC regulatory subunit McrC
VYEGAFFGREIRPDIVLKKEEDVAVFDVKYKR